MPTADFGHQHHTIKSIDDSLFFDDYSPSMFMHQQHMNNGPQMPSQHLTSSGELVGMKLEPSSMSPLMASSRMVSAFYYF
jgi:hypothetical protein